MRGGVNKSIYPEKKVAFGAKWRQNVLVMKKQSQIQVKVETRNPSLELQGVVNLVIQRNDSTRLEVVTCIRSWGFGAHCGGRHVAILVGNERVAIVTHPTAPDFN